MTWRITPSVLTVKNHFFNKSFPRLYLKSTTECQFIAVIGRIQVSHLVSDPHPPLFLNATLQILQWIPHTSRLFSWAEDSEAEVCWGNPGFQVNLGGLIALASRSSATAPSFSAPSSVCNNFHCRNILAHLLNRNFIPVHLPENTSHFLTSK
jgi:hypothetical protein